MKRQLVHLILACSAACIAVSNLHAQSFVTQGNIPFEFHVGKSTLPAGTYRFSQEGMSTHQVIRNKQSGESILVMATPSLKGSPQPRVVFNRYGKQYFLREIWTVQGTGLHLGMSNEEKEAREATTLSQEARLSVTLLAQR